MKLGKRFSLLKKRYNAGEINMTFTRKDDGSELKPHRKLNMLLVLSFLGNVSKKAIDNEFNKMNRRYGKQNK